MSGGQMALHMVRQQAFVTVSSDQTSVFILSNVLSGMNTKYTTRPTEVILTINSAITLQQGLYITGLAAGSFVRIINNGNIYGVGGGGGTGITIAGVNAPGYSSIYAPTPGNAGGDAIYTTTELQITNNGNIFGGGGGGGSGGELFGLYPPFFYPTTTYYDFSLGGGGGGGGQGYGSSGGGGGTGGYYQYNSTPAAGDGFWVAGQQDSSTTSSVGTSGSAGNVSGAGTGGAGCAGWSGGVAYPNSAQPGGDGGAWGLPGNNSGGVFYMSAINGGTGSYGVSASGGPAGYAVRLNSSRVTWLAGNNGTQVKGSVA